MLFKLILLLTVVPLTELLLLVKLTQWTGSFLLTVGIVLATGVVGAVLARAEGLRVVRNMQQEVQQGRMPTERILDGVMILVAGALLVTPGLMTDTVGFLLLIPFTRAAFRKAVKRWVRRKMESGEFRVSGSGRWRPIRKEPPPDSPPMEDED